jgi:hypothetical protein
MVSWHPCFPQTGKPEMRGWWLTDKDFREADWEARAV